MKKILILIPVYNDWESLKKLIGEINANLKDFDYQLGHNFTPVYERYFSKIRFIYPFQKKKFL